MEQKEVKDKKDTKRLVALIPEKLKQDLMIEAIRSGKTVSELVEQGVRLVLDKKG